VPSRGFRTVVALLVCIQLVACASWKPSDVHPSQVAPEDFPSWTRVVLTDGRQIELVDASLQSGVISAEVPCDGRCRTSRIGVEIPVEEVAGFEERRTNTVASIVAVALVLGPIIWLGIESSKWDGICIGCGAR